ncbi:hypothetical protein B0H12DRAFT_1113489 [Mycena haematopus]|nr:hypothetical protein B0H12DRAFT_1113489 [Mycena haematopus]
MVCSICYERFTAPVALPCGHIFCRECIRRAADTTPMYAVQHFCPTCRAGYNIVTLDSALVPAYMRPYILPTLRPVFFDDPAPEFGASDYASTSEGTTAEAALAKRTNHSVEALHLSCATWRQRAEVLAAANARLLGFARAAKEYTVCMRAERDQALDRCAVLERKLAELMLETEGAVSRPDSEQGRLRHAELPARTQQVPAPQSARRPNSSLDIHPMLAHFLAGPSDASLESIPPATFAMLPSCRCA